MNYTNPALAAGALFTLGAMFTRRWPLPELDGSGVFNRLHSEIKEEAAELPHYHKTVLLQESVDALTTKSDLTIVDATLGGGGHTEALLESGCRVISVDQDPEAIQYAKQRLSRFGDRVTFCEGNFSELTTILSGLGIESIDGLLADLGVSSRQLDVAERGFSMQKDGPLDMRMGPSAKLSAADLVNTWDQDAIADVIYRYGDETASRRIAKAIVERRATKPFTRTLELANVIEKLIGRRGKTHPATKTFQAIRIAVNDELGVLESLLEQSVRVLKPGGRLAIITFHSLEDRIVKHFIRERSQKEIDRPEWPAPRPNPNYTFTEVTRKATEPSADEIKRNPRSRSAKLRTAERI